MLLFAKRLAVVIGMAIFSTTFVDAQQNPVDFVTGQEVVAAAEDFDVAIEQLFSVGLTVEEIDYFLATMVSLEAWARTNQFGTKGCLEDLPLLEGIQGLGFWKDVNQPSLPFATVYTKVVLAFLYSDPAEDSLAAAQAIIDDANRAINDPDADEEDRAFYGRRLENAKVHLATIESLPEGHQQVYASRKAAIVSSLDRFDSLVGLEELAPIAFTSGSLGLQIRGSGSWLRNEGVGWVSYRQEWLPCSLNFMTAPWSEGDELDESVVKVALAGLISGTPNMVIDELTPGEVNGRKDYRVRYHDSSQKTHGFAYLTGGSEELFILLYGGADKDWDLLQPIIEECFTQLEFGDYPVPVLVDRSSKGYRIHAESPWTAEVEPRPGIDLELSHGYSQFVIEIQSFEVENAVSKFEGFCELAHNSSLETIPDATIVENGVIELGGLPCGISEAYGSIGAIFEGEDVILQQRLYSICIGDTFILFTLKADQKQWAENEPIAAKLLENVQFIDGVTSSVVDSTKGGPGSATQNAPQQSLAQGDIPEPKQAPEPTFLGQAEVTMASDLEQAMDQLYGYEITRVEVDYFISTLVSLEAWSRSHQYQVKNSFLALPIYEAIRNLDYWNEMGVDPMPFATAYTKLLLAFLYADPEQGALVDTKAYIEKTRAVVNDETLGQDERIFAQDNLTVAEEHLTLLESIPPSNAQLFQEMRAFISPALEHFERLSYLESEAPEIFTLSSIGLRSRGTGLWTRNEGMDHHSYNLVWPPLSLDITTAPWTGSNTLADVDVVSVLSEALSGRADIVLGNRVHGDVFGRKDVRVRYHNPVEKTQGLAYLTVANQQLYILLYGGLDEQWKMAQPIVEENYSQLEFGDYPMPLLRDRTAKGYQVFAEMPWREQLDRPINLDMRLVHGSSPVILDISVFEPGEDSNYDHSRFEEFVSYIHGTNLAEYENPTTVQSGLFEWNGLPCGVSEIYGVKSSSAAGQDQMVLHQRQVFVYHNGRFIHFNVQANQSDWSSVAALAEQVITNVRFVGLEDKVLLDQSAKGYLIKGSPEWNAVLLGEQQPEANLLLGHPDTAISITRTVGLDLEQLRDNMERLYNSTSEQYANRQDYTSTTGELCGVPAGWGSFQGDLVGAEENGKPVRVYAEFYVFLHEGESIIFNMMTRYEDRVASSAKVKALLEGLSFVATQ